MFSPISVEGLYTNSPDVGLVVITGENGGFFECVGLVVDKAPNKPPFDGPPNVACGELELVWGVGKRVFWEVVKREF